MKARIYPTKKMQTAIDRYVLAYIRMTIIVLACLLTAGRLNRLRKF